MLIHLWLHTLIIITHTASVGVVWASLEVEPVDPLMFEWGIASVRTVSDMVSQYSSDKHRPSFII